MFAMLNGGWPRVTGRGTALPVLEAEVAAGLLDATALSAEVDALVAHVVSLQVDAGLEPVTDGYVRWADAGEAAMESLLRPGGPTPFLLPAWHATAALTERAVAQAVPGPYSTARRLTAGRPGLRRRRRTTLALAEALAAELRGLLDAGCPVVVVEEPGAVEVGDDAAERELFVDAQRRLLAGAPELHTMLSITGGAAVAAGAGTVFAPPYHSHLFDLIAGPDNWTLIRQAPPERGIVCGALRATDDREDPLPVLVWAARYAASTGGRGIERVGLANASSLAALSPDAAAAKLGFLGKAARMVTMSLAEALEEGFEPRAVSSRMAALGPHVARPRRRARGSGGTTEERSPDRPEA